MKTVKAKLHHHRKSKAGTHSAPISQDGAEAWALDHDLPDPDFQLYRIERSPKQENL
jgi:hypothetical protein